MSAVLNETETDRVDQLMKRLQWLEAQEDVVKKELRKLIYKIEAGR